MTCRPDSFLAREMYSGKGSIIFTMCRVSSQVFLAIRSLGKKIAVTHSEV